MNINPSDTDVRQGYAPAEGIAQAIPVPAPQQKPRLPEPESQPGPDAQSAAAITAADRQSARDAAEDISKKLGTSDTSLKIRVLDNPEEGVQVEILDAASKKVLRKIPQDELIKLSASIKKMTGVFLNKQT